MVILVVVHGPDKGRVITLADGGRHTIGRNELSLSDSKISRHHARLIADGTRWVLQDLGSTNGTFVNRHRLRGKTRLSTGDRVLVGRTEFMFSVVTAQDDVGTLASVSATSDTLDDEPIGLPLEPQPVNALTESESEYAVNTADWPQSMYRPQHRSVGPLFVGILAIVGLSVTAYIWFEFRQSRQRKPHAAQPTIVQGAATPAGAAAPAAPAAAPTLPTTAAAVNTEPRGKPIDPQQTILSAVRAQIDDKPATPPATGDAPTDDKRNN